MLFQPCFINFCSAAGPDQASSACTTSENGQTQSVTKKRKRKKKSQTLGESKQKEQEVSATV